MSRKKKIPNRSSTPNRPPNTDKKPLGRSWLVDAINSAAHVCARDKLLASSTYGKHALPEADTDLGYADGYAAGRGAVAGGSRLIERARANDGILELCVTTDADDLQMEPIMRWRGRDLPERFDRASIHTIAERVCIAEAERLGVDTVSLEFTLTAQWQVAGTEGGYGRGGGVSSTSFNVHGSARREEPVALH